MKQLNKNLKWALPALFALATAALLWLFGSYTRTEQSLAFLTPTFENTQGWEIYSTENGVRTALTGRELLNVAPWETFYLSRVLDETLEEAGFTFLMLDAYRPASVFLDGKLLYTTLPKPEQRLDTVSFPAGWVVQPERGEYVRCTLPPGYTGRMLTIATAHVPLEYGPELPGIRLSSETVESQKQMSAASGNAIPAAVLATLVMLLIGLTLYQRYQGRWNWSLLLLTVAALSQMLHYLQEYSYIAPFLTPLDTSLSSFFQPMALILPEFFLLAQMRRRRKVCAVFVLISAAIALVPPVCYLFGPLSFSDTPFSEALYVSLVALLICAVMEARDGNRVFCLFWIGLGSIGAGVLALSLFSPYDREALIGTVRLAADHIPIPLLPWCGSALLVLGAAISVFMLVRDTADTQARLAVQIERSDRLDYELAVQKQFYETKLSREDELRTLRHNMLGHLSTLSALLSTEKIEDARKYLAEVSELTQNPQSEVFCENPYLNAVLGTYAHRFRENKVTFVFRAVVDKLELPGPELSLIVNNALENALDASIRLPEGERSVKLQAAIQQGRFLLRVSNRFSGELQKLDGFPMTSKSDKGHGYGFASIRQTASRLGGSADYRVEQGHFVLDVYFSVPE